MEGKAHRVERVGQTARRLVGPGGERVHELLVALEKIGFPYAPRFLGIDDRGREVLTWFDGESGSDGWAGGGATGDAETVICHGDFGPWNLV